MSRTKKELNRTDELLDELLLDYRTPEDILGEGGLLKQLSQRLIERALAGELSHHLKPDHSFSEAANERKANKDAANGTPFLFYEFGIKVP